MSTWTQVSTRSSVPQPTNNPASIPHIPDFTNSLPLDEPKKAALFCHILQYFTIFFDIKNLLIHPVRCQFREYVLLFQPSPASGAGGEWQARVALALFTDQSQPASERPSAERYGLPVLTWEWGLKIRKTWINMAGILIHIIENLEIRVG